MVTEFWSADAFLLHFPNLFFFKSAESAEISSLSMKV
jgi:hypothetical protein